MKFSKYRTKSIRTLAPLAVTYNVQHNTELPNMLDSVHMVLGMTSELCELRAAILNKDKINISEELADIMWYVSGECTIRNVNLTLEFSELQHKLTDVNIDNLLLSLTTSISEYADIVKKEFAYRKGVESHFYQLHLSTIFNSVANVANYFNIDMENALQNNIDKLMKRFPDKFNEHDAINRNLEAERKELEK